MKKSSVALIALFVLCGSLAIAPTVQAQVSGQTLWTLISNRLQPVVSTWGLKIPALANKACIGTDSAGVFQTGTCGGGSGSSAWATTTSNVSGQLIVYPVNSATDIVTIGSNSTTTAEFYFDPNVPKAFITNASSSAFTATNLYGGNLLMTGSSTFQNFTGLNATTSNATSTTLFSTTLTSTGATTTGQLSAGWLTVSGSTTLQNFTALNATTSSATTTALSILGTASTSKLRIDTLAAGTLNINQGAVYSGATTTFSTGLTYSAGNTTCDTANASTFGCLTAAFFSKFNSATTTFSTGITYSAGNVTCDIASASIFGCLTSASFSKFNSATTTFSNGLAYSAGVASLATISANSVLGNNTSGAAIPTSLATSSLFTGSAGQVGYFNGTGGLIGTSTLFIATNGNVGVASSTPWGSFVINPTAGVASNQFVVGSSTATNFVINNSGNVGIASTSPAFKFGVNNAGSDFYVTSIGRLVGWDTTINAKGVISPTHAFSLSSGTTTAWTASTTASAYSPQMIMPFTGTIQQFSCIPMIGASAGSFIGVNIKVNGSNITPSYIIASSTVGVMLTSNTFTKGQIILADFGTTTTATATSISCTVLVTETP